MLGEHARSDDRCHRIPEKASRTKSMSDHLSLATRTRTESTTLSARVGASLPDVSQHPSDTRGGARRMADRWVISGIALAVLAVHLASNGLYGFQRDEMYYLDSARHLAWGFVDYPPLTPAIARLSLLLFGPTSVWGLRLWPSLAGAVLVVLSAQIAHELGGGRTTRILAAIGAATSPVLLGANWLFQTVTFDQLMWLICVWLAARLVRTGDHRLWLALGAAVGIGLETKYTIVALIAGLDGRCRSDPIAPAAAHTLAMAGDPARRPDLSSRT